MAIQHARGTLTRGKLIAVILLLVTLSLPSLAQSWEFNSGSTQGWWAAHSVSNLQASGGYLAGDVTGGDPYIIGPPSPNIDADANPFIQIRMKIDAGTVAEFFWGTEAQPYHVGGREVAFPLTSDNQFHDYYVDMSTNAQWTGLVNTLRLDPSTESTGHFEVDYIRVIPEAPAILTATSPSARDRFAFAGEIVIVAVTIRNDGYSTATDLQATLDVSGQTVLTPQPLTEASLAPGYDFTFQWTVRADTTGISDMHATIYVADPALTIEMDSQLIVSTPRPSLPSAAPLQAQAWTDGDGNAVIENSKVRLAFFNNSFGYALAELYVRDGNTWELVAATAPLSRVAYRRADETESTVLLIPDLATPAATPTGARLELPFDCPDANRGAWRGSLVYELDDASDLIRADYSVLCTAQRDLVAWFGPSLCAGNRTFRTLKSQALFPGLEWLIGDEESSNTLECAAGVNLRLVPHPYKVTIPLMAVSGDYNLIALLWDPMQQWDGQHAYPCAVFSSPNWFQSQDNHLMELFVPTIPDWVSETSTAASVPFSLAPGQQLTLTGRFLARVGAEVLDAIDTWSTIYGLPELPGGPGFLEAGLLTAREGFMTTIWDPVAKGWPHAVGWGPYPAPEFSQDLYADSIDTDPTTRASLRARANEAIQQAIALSGEYELGSGIYSHIPDYRLPYFVGYLDSLASKMDADAQGIMASQQPDGGWFVPTNPAHPELTTPGTKELGSCAYSAYRLLRYARTTGDRASLAAGRRALAYMERFVVPRAAQVWEVPQHAPDILAAAWACGAYLEAYLLTGQQDALARARYWARAGLPFIYLWSAADRQIMEYGTIPVFGSTFFTLPWFGLPVQWCGLVHAYFINRLAPYDDSTDWHAIAEGITRSGIQQMNVSPYLGTYGDSINILYSNTPNPVYINPDNIYKCAGSLLGRWGDVNLKTVYSASKTASISSGARIPLGCFNSDNALVFKVAYRASETCHVLVCGFGLPTAVFKNGHAQGWSYNSSLDALVIEAVMGSDESVFTVISGAGSVPVSEVEGPAQAKALPDGDVVIFNNVVTSGTGELAGGIYVQSEDGFSGIRVSLAHDPLTPINIGDRVEIIGTMATADGERYVSDADLQVIP